MTKLHDQALPRNEQVPEAEGSKRPYVAPALVDEEVFERTALANCTKAVVCEDSGGTPAS